MTATEQAGAWWVEQVSASVGMPGLACRDMVRGRPRRLVESMESGAETVSP
jgi:hypothetical protein